MVEQYTYDSYGTPTFLDPTGNNLNGVSAFGVDFLFAGSRWNSITGLYDNRHRHYAPDWGRFLQADPLGFKGDPANLYATAATMR